MTTANDSFARVFQREIERFVEATARSALLYQNRRRKARHHRECPLLIARLPGGPDSDVAATLHDISSEGIGFLCDAGYPVGTVIGIKLFWSDSDATRVPAVVRHCEIHAEGFLVGAEFAVDDDRACNLIAQSPLAWYG